ncbi:hypothetical protein MUP07_09605 [Candidatus Bathyarchaeota archaeon]|nr:hypothetical protein [Candidatus Bathyarchaeota archaeon]
MNTETAEAILIANLKGPRRKRLPLIEIAEAVRLLRKKYGSTKKLAQAFDVSRPIIESFDRILDQPTAIKRLIAKDAILLDASTKLASIKDPHRRIELAKEIAGETAFDSRDIIDYAKKHPRGSAKECKRAVFASKEITRELHVIVLPLEDELFKGFKMAATTRKMRLEDAGKLAIREWVEREEH